MLPHYLREGSLLPMFDEVLHQIVPCDCVCISNYFKVHKTMMLEGNDIITPHRKTEPDGYFVTVV